MLNHWGHGDQKKTVKEVQSFAAWFESGVKQLLLKYLN